jgi:hypothetical protein
VIIFLRPCGWSAGVSLPSNLDRYRKDLDSLIAKGEQLYAAIQAESRPAEYRTALRKALANDSKKLEERLRALPSFRDAYQGWYSEAKVVVRQLLPDRLSDFVRHYEKPKSRRDISYESYRIEDYLQGLATVRGSTKEVIVGPDAAISQFRQQLAILESARGRFESSLFDIRSLVQADLFDSELSAADALARNGFARAAGAVAGVVLEKHLAQVCNNHAVGPAKKLPSISDLNDALKTAEVIDIPQWRFIQHLTDIRNLCDHSRTNEPTADQVGDLVSGVRKMTKTLF